MISRKSTKATGRRKTAATPRTSTAAAAGGPPGDEPREDKTPGDEPYGGLPLHAAIIAFQKAMARANEDVLERKDADVGLLLGQRTLYGVTGLEVELRADVRVQKAERGAAPEVVVGFDTPPERRSVLRFRVDPVPVQPVRGPGVVLSAIPHGTEGASVQRFQALAIDEAGAPAPSVRLQIVLQRIGSPPAMLELDAYTDADGKVEFELDLDAREVRVIAMTPETKHLPGPPKRGDWRVWVERKPAAGEGAMAMATPRSAVRIVRRDS